MEELGFIRFSYNINLNTVYVHREICNTYGINIESESSNRYGFHKGRLTWNI